MTSDEAFEKWWYPYGGGAGVGMRTHEKAVWDAGVAFQREQDLKAVEAVKGDDIGDYGEGWLHVCEEIAKRIKEQQS